MLIDYRPFGDECLDDIKELYNEEGWSSYLNNDEKLISAFKNSLSVFGAFIDGKLIGFIRAVGDGEHILFVQDLIVAKEYRKNGIGEELLNSMRNRYKDVRRIIVVTDLYDNIANSFYFHRGLCKICEGDMVAYFEDRR